MPENIIEAFDALGKEIRALKKELEYKTWDNETLKAKNKELQEQVSCLQQELKAAAGVNIDVPVNAIKEVNENGKLRLRR